MKNGKCTKCGASDIWKAPNIAYQRDFRALTTFSGVKLTEYVCCSCGLVETYLADMRDVDKIKKKSVKVETTE
jgi:hypothetical protein